MFVKDLIALLKGCDQESKVLFLPTNSSYAENFGQVRENTAIRSFWGTDYKATIITSDGQVGSV